MGIGQVVLGVPLGGGAKPTNTVAPAINAAAVIGTEIVGDDGTWVPAATSFTYQWQRYTGGAWADIALATNKNYTPVDDDFGLALRLVVTATPGLNTANSNSTNLTQEAPTQSLSAELVVNGTFAAWTGDNPDSWTVTGEAAGDPEVTQRSSTQTHAEGPAGTGAANLYNSASATYNPVLSQAVLTVGNYAEFSGTVSDYAAGTATLQDAVAGLAVSRTSAGDMRALGRTSNANFQARAGNVAPTDFTLDVVSAKTLTLNTQLTAPSADMRLDQFYTLPGSPAAGTQVWLLPRISAFTTGNYWVVVLVYTGSQWNINLYSVATHTRTSRIAATNIGATNGIRMNMNGDQLSLWSTANGGTDWTQRGTTITNNTYQANTGVNALWTSDFTAGNLVFAAAV